jgi:hypothetical protein
MPTPWAAPHSAAFKGGDSGAGTGGAMEEEAKEEEEEDDEMEVSVAREAGERGSGFQPSSYQCRHSETLGRTTITWRRFASS